MRKLKKGFCSPLTARDIELTCFNYKSSGKRGPSCERGLGVGGGGRLSHLVLHVASQPRQRDGSAMDLALKQALEHHLAESAVRASRQERVQLRTCVYASDDEHAARVLARRLGGGVLRTYLHQKLQVYILALRCGSDLLLVAATGLQVDTLRGCTGRVSSSSGGSGRGREQRTQRTMLRRPRCATRAGKERCKHGGGESPGNGKIARGWIPNVPADRYSRWNVCGTYDTIYLDKVALR